MARQAEVPPLTASVVAQSSYAWDDDAWLERRAASAAHDAADERLRGAPRVVAPGAVLPSSWPSSWSSTSAGSATPTSSCCRWPSTRSAAPGATRSRRTTRRRRASARPTTSATSSTAAPGRHRRHRRLGPRALPQGRVRARPLRRDRRSTSTPTRGAASRWTGAPTSSTSAATRCATSSSPTPSTGSRSSTSTGCASTRSRRCSTSTTRARKGSGSPTSYGGRENLEAVAFLQEMNAVVYREVPAAMTIAEESTSWPGVTRATHLGGLGFGFKWNMGWMHDSLDYVAHEPDLPRLPPPPDDVLDGLRLLRELRAADQPRRGRARQGLAAAQDARRPLAAARQRPRLPRLHVGAPRQAAAVHGVGVRAGVGVERGPLARLVADRPPRPPRRRAAGEGPERDLQGTSALWSQDTDAAGFAWIDANDADGQRLLVPALRRRRVSRSPASRTSPACRTRTTASACPGPASGPRCSTPTRRSTPAAASATSAR